MDTFVGSVGVYEPLRCGREGGSGGKGREGREGKEGLIPFSFSSFFFFQFNI